MTGKFRLVRRMECKVAGQLGSYPWTSLDLCIRPDECRHVRTTPPLVSYCERLTRSARQQMSLPAMLIRKCPRALPDRALKA